jgi:hypothetical protein
MLAWYSLRWRLDVTGQEARTHFGMERQRLWNAQAIPRMTPALEGSCRLIMLVASQLAPDHGLPVRQSM